MDDATRWAPAPGTFGRWEVSDRGEVRTVEGHKPLVGYLTWHGYRKLALRKDGIRHRFYLHDLVLSAFDRERSPGEICRHLDDVKLNNRLENLRWGTPSENQRDAVRNGIHWNTRKRECPKGHPYSASNTYVSPDGDRHCRACKRERERQLRLSNKASSLVA